MIAITALSTAEYACRSKFLVFERKKASCILNFFLLIGTGKVSQPPKNGVLKSLKSLERNRSYSPPYSDIARSIGGGSVHSDCFVIARY